MTLRSSTGRASALQAGRSPAASVSRAVRSTVEALESRRLMAVNPAIDVHRGRRHQPGHQQNGSQHQLLRRQHIGGPRQQDGRFCPDACILNLDGV